MSPAEVQTFLVAFLVLFGLGLAGTGLAELWARRQARLTGTPKESIGRWPTAAVVVVAIMLDAALAMALVLIGRQTS